VILLNHLRFKKLKESFKFEIMAKEKTKYTDKELAEFEKLILKKRENAQKELDFIKESLLRSNLSGTDSNTGALKTLEDGADTMEKESLSQLAGRQQKFISNLEKALIRIKNGTYGICKDSGKLIDKKRLRAVPHATQSIEAKLKRG
jgi:RNA polymerase-binding transcription factor DksA